FLLWDVLTNAWEPADKALGSHHYVTAVTYGGVMLVCVGAGLIGLVYFDRWMKRRAARLRPEGPGAATAQPALIPAGPDAARGQAAGLSMLIAVGIGMHNFGEGLAIGASAASGELSLALLGLIGGGPTFVGTIVGMQVTAPLLEIAFLALAAGSILYVVIELLAVA